MKRALQLLLSLLASAFFLWVAFHRVEFDKVWELLRTVNLPLVGVYIVTLVFIQFARGLRWGVLIRPFAKLPVSSVLRVSNVGLLMVLVLPLRLGEFARPYLMKKEGGTPMSATIGAVVVERVIDGLLVTLLFFVSTMTSPVPAALRAAAFVSLAIFAGAAAFVVAAWLARAQALRLLERILHPVSPRLAQRAVGMLDAFVSGVRSLPNTRSLCEMVGWTIAYWLANGLGYYAIACAFGWNLPLAAGFTLVSVIVIAIMIPAGPGFLGTFQGGILAGLALYGVGVNEATAFGLIAYPIATLVTVGFGLPYLFTPKARLSEIVHAGPEVPQEAVGS